MASLVTLSLFLCCMLGLAGYVQGHGRLLMPYSRASAWRFRIQGAKVDYDDNQGFCGGYKHQKDQGGKCGICGDPWDKTPRDHELPDGKYAMSDITGILRLNNFTSGQVIRVIVEITTHHMGYFEFYVCSVDSLGPLAKDATVDCLHQHRLFIVNASDYRYVKPRHKNYQENVHYQLDLRLPPRLACRHCVLQWRYHTGNNWGVDDDGTECLGCGPQEEFYGCADIAINLDPYTVAIPHHLMHLLTDREKEVFICNYCFELIFIAGMKRDFPQFCINLGFPNFVFCPR